MSILDGPGKKEKTEAKSYGEFHCKKKWKNKKKFIKQFNKTQKKMFCVTLLWICTPMKLRTVFHFVACYAYLSFSFCKLTLQRKNNILFIYLLSL